jgi:hypothetical protein
MPINERVAVTCTGLDSEDLYFKKQEEERLKKLRESCQTDSNQAYREQHKNHCFRCGTPSLAEINHGDIKIDVCVNEGCGAVHLDPGELDQIVAKDTGALKKVQVAVFSIFK